METPDPFPKKKKKIGSYPNYTLRLTPELRDKIDLADRHGYDVAEICRRALSDRFSTLASKIETPAVDDHDEEVVDEYEVDYEAI